MLARKLSRKQHDVEGGERRQQQVKTVSPVRQQSVVVLKKRTAEYDITNVYWWHRTHFKKQLCRQLVLYGIRTVSQVISGSKPVQAVHRIKAVRSVFITEWQPS